MFKKMAYALLSFSLLALGGGIRSESNAAAYMDQNGIPFSAVPGLMDAIQSKGVPEIYPMAGSGSQYYLKS